MAAQVILLAMVGWLFQLIDAKTALMTFIMSGGLLVLASMRTFRRRPAAIHLCIAVMLSVSAAVLFYGASPETLQAMGRDPSLTDRTKVWAALLGLVQNPVLGTGFESFWLGPRLEKMWSLYWWHPNQAHNGYLEIYLNLGWVGIILILSILAISYAKIIRDWRTGAVTGSLQLAYFFCGLVFNFTEAALFRMQAAVWIFMLFAITNRTAMVEGRKGTAKSADDQRQSGLAHGRVWQESRVGASSELMERPHACQSPR
jgi:O-antigen ligase